MSLAEDLRAACPALRLDEPLRRHTSFGIGGPADYYADVNTLEELIALRKLVERSALSVFFIGAGSNLLVSDRGIRGLVIHLQGEFRKIEFQGSEVAVGAAAWMPAVSRQCAERGLAGAEPLIGIPGTIGGGLVMNAGTRDGALGDVVRSVRIVGPRGVCATRTPGEAAFGYRRSALENEWLAGAVLGLKPEESRHIISRIDSYLQYRTRTQPLATSNCGSVFKNPAQAAAAQLVEQAGFKGAAVGGARVSERHANFIINEKDARASDVDALILQIQEKVFQQSGIRLETEVKKVGQW